MYQRNDSSGRRREVRRTEGSGVVWIFNSEQRVGQGAPRWTPFSMCVQRKLEEVFQRLKADGDLLIEAESLASHECIITDIIAHSSQSPDRSAPSEPSNVHQQKLNLDDTVALVHQAPCTLSADQSRHACDSALAPGTDPRVSYRIMQPLVMKHHFRCSIDDVRKAALFVGSMSVMHLVLASAPDLQLVGESIFDKRYPGIKINGENGCKNCLKALLARGARLGDPNNIPTSKLLRKIEADALNPWADRYLLSLSHAGVELPDNVQAVVRTFIASQV